jgi:phospholipid/cholesterol/gamma-HCH transport system substrate-binding protein
MLLRFKAEIAVGLIFIAALAILGYYTIYMASRFLEPKETYYISSVFPTIEGLEMKAKVKVNGVESGKVDSITLNGHNVLVRLKMYNPFVLYGNYSIRVRNDSLLGKKMVSIFTGTPIDKNGIEQKIITARDGLPGLYEDPLGNAANIIEENRENIYLTIRNVKDISEKINRGQGTLGKLINEDKIHGEADELVRELRETIEDAREQAPITSFIRAALTAF